MRGPDLVRVSGWAGAACMSARHAWVVTKLFLTSAYIG